MTRALTESQVAAMSDAEYYAAEAAGLLRNVQPDVTSGPPPTAAPLSDFQVVRGAEPRVNGVQGKPPPQPEAQRAPLPEPIGLAAFLAVPDEPIAYRIDGLLPVGGRAIVAAQFKAGKTILVGNLMRSFTDADDFLGRFATTPGRVTRIDDEMDARQLRRWLRGQGIRNQDQAKVLTLRGSVATFDIINPQVRAAWMEQLQGTEILIFDCLRPVLDALGLDENRDAGRFLVAFDALLKDAGISEAVLIHHMGHNGERSRGDSRLRDWPDAEWRLVRTDDKPDSPRYFSAYGRDVDVPETGLAYDAASRHLTAEDGSRRDARQPPHSRMSLTLSAARTSHSAAGRSKPLSVDQSTRKKRSVMR